MKRIPDGEVLNNAGKPDFVTRIIVARHRYLARIIHQGAPSIVQLYDANLSSCSKFHNNHKQEFRWLTSHSPNFLSPDVDSHEIKPFLRKVHDLSVNRSLKFKNVRGPNHPTHANANVVAWPPCPKLSKDMKEQIVARREIALARKTNRK